MCPAVKHCRLVREPVYPGVARLNQADQTETQTVEIRAVEGRPGQAGNGLSREDLMQAGRALLR